MTKAWYLELPCEHRFRPQANDHGSYVCAQLRVLCRDGYGKRGCFYEKACPFCGMVLPTGGVTL